ncbi:MAG TPA: BMP family ABC transporter substrate-binding protein [Anaerolineales bacterium]|jgi:basic membrane protein A|nr:BMP family ABC transporter substrate-binding protein [Anaerolineales bacterium]
MKHWSILFARFLALVILVPACAPARPDCTKEEIFCVGMVTDVGKINDRGFNQSAWRGIQQAQEELGALVQYIETSDTRDYAKNIATFANENYDVIVTVGFNLRETTRAAAETYPDVKFIGVDQDQFEGEMENVAGLIFPEDHAGFLVGALAAMMSETHMVGAVCASDDIPPVWRLGEGYKAGAAYADEVTGITTEVLVLYHSDVSFDTTFVDPEWGAASTDAMAKEGVDVLFGCGGVTGNGALVAAAQAGLYTIGVDTDQYLTLPEAAPRMLSSAMKLITPGVFELLQRARDGSFPAGNYLGDVSYAPFHDLDNQVPQDVKAAMEEIHAGLRNGSIKTDVPSQKP